MWLCYLSVYSTLIPFNKYLVHLFMRCVSCIIDTLKKFILCNCYDKIENEEGPVGKGCLINVFSSLMACNDFMSQ